jgi:hypothetical protein
MASGAHSTIWRDGAEPTTTVGTEDIIEFGTGALVNTGAHITNVAGRMPTGIARNERPGAMDKLQDTGIIGLTVDISGVVEDPWNGGLAAVSTMKAWAFEAKTVDTTFPKGRFGLRLNDFGLYNLVPTSTLGYMLSNLEFIRNGETKGKAEFVMTLRLNGDPGTADGSGYFSW